MTSYLKNVEFKKNRCVPKFLKSCSRFIYDIFLRKSGSSFLFKVSATDKFKPNVSTAFKISPINIQIIKSDEFCIPFAASKIIMALRLKENTS